MNGGMIVCVCDLHFVAILLVPVNDLVILYKSKIGFKFCDETKEVFMFFN